MPTEVSLLAWESCTSKHKYLKNNLVTLTKYFSLFLYFIFYLVCLVYLRLKSSERSGVQELSFEGSKMGISRRLQVSLLKMLTCICNVTFSVQYTGI